jgi:hypothetical protein
MIRPLEVLDAKSDCVVASDRDPTTLLMRAYASRSAVCNDFLEKKSGSLNARHSDDDRKIARELRSKSYSFQNLAHRMCFRQNLVAPGSLSILGTMLVVVSSDQSTFV